LADLTGLSQVNLSAYDENGSRQHDFDLTVEETAVRATVYEPQVAASVAPPPPPSESLAEARPPAAALQEPLRQDDAAETAVSETPPRVWQVVPTAMQPEAPAWVIGSIVHEALALWRFPGPAFAAWVTARARGFGLTDPQQLHHAQTETSRLLRRFQQHSLFQEIAASEKRLHEVPYSYQHNGAVETGRIDLLYWQEGAWKLVDFKTDSVRNEAALQQLLAAKDYSQQVRRYGTVVQQHLGVAPQLFLCFLNCGGDVRLAQLIESPWNLFT
jgi:ATP-dependent exoDNAse (exonuclease V) beta subunit